jgi:hypothetical protein
MLTTHVILLLCATAVVTRDVGLYGLIRRTGMFNYGIRTRDARVIRSLHQSSNHCTTRATIQVYVKAEEEAVDS